MAQGTELPTARDTSLMALGRADFFILFILYVLVLVVAGARLAIVTLCAASSQIQELQIWEILSCSALCGSAIFYSRKLYKAGINQEYDFSPEGFTIARISTIAYFIIRLPTSIAFSLIAYALWRLSVDLAGDAEFSPGSSSRYVFVVMGFFAGFSAGKFMAHFEKDGFNIAARWSTNNDQR